MADKRPVVPIPGNAFSENAYRDSLKVTAAAQDGAKFIADDVKDNTTKPLPEAPQIRTLDRDSSGDSIAEEKKPADMNLPKGTSDKVEMPPPKRAVIQVATPLTQGFVSQIKNAFGGKNRAATDPIPRKNLDNPAPVPRTVSIDASSTGAISRDAQVSRDDKPSRKSRQSRKGKGRAQDVPQQVTSKKEPATETGIPPTTTGQVKEPALTTASTVEAHQPEISSLDEPGPSGTHPFSPNVFKGGEPAFFQGVPRPNVSFFAPDDSEQETERKKGSPPQQRHQAPDAIVLGQGSPTRSGTLARPGSIHIQPAPRVISMSGLVENVIPVGMPEISAGIYSPVGLPNFNNPFSYNGPQNLAHMVAQQEFDAARRNSHETNAGTIQIGYRVSEEGPSPGFVHPGFNNFCPPPPGREFKPPGWHEELMYKVTDIPHHLIRETTGLAREINAKHSIQMDYILRRTDAVERRLTDMVLELAQKIVPLHEGPENVVAAIMEVSQKVSRIEETQERQGNSIIELGQKVTTLIEELHRQLSRLINDVVQQATSLKEAQDIVSKSVGALSNKIETVEDSLERLTKSVNGLSLKMTAVEEGQERLPKTSDIRGQTNELRNAIVYQRANASTKMDAILSRLDTLNNRFDGFDQRLNTLARSHHSGLQLAENFYGAETGQVIPRGNAFALNAAAAAAGHNPILASIPDRVSGPSTALVADAPAFVPGTMPSGPYPHPGFYEWYQQASFPHQPQQQGQQTPRQNPNPTQHQTQRQSHHHHQRNQQS
ncbi:MAG: hypothetical protein M1816_001927 [Peltula sp. TS41687]|nr:MAG: hypothetical protein M1816_001927 [Peltula sp. TS41687]